MAPANAARIQEWDARPVSDGYRGLRELADEGFSGSVTTGAAWLFMLNGRVVGVVDGTLSSFESVDLTAYEAPDPTPPLLFAMQERGGETQAKYYTDDNPLPDVHRTLTEANFTGYIELSENVLSGDYYVVYYGGKSMSAAFVGNAEKLLTGDEAFRQAAEEVGIYEVVAVDLDVRDVPEPAAADEPVTTTPPPDAEPTESEPDEATGGPAPDEEAPPEPQSDVDEPTLVNPTEVSPENEPGPSAEAADSEPRQPTDVATGSTGGQDAEDPFSQEAAWRETRTIPALDPEETDAPAATEDGGQQQTATAPPEVGVDREAPVDEDRIAELEAAIETQSATIADLKSKLESTSTQAQQLRAERNELEGRLAAAREGDTTGSAAPTPAAEPLDPETALDQTDLFVRYKTKAGGTLEKAHDGILEREEVVENLRIDHHTRFEEDAVTVEGRPFETFLSESLEYQFVMWLITEFLFEIQDTGSQRGLRDLFDVLPLVDRVEFYGTVTWRDPDAEETYSQEFDVICRDRMGQALIVANLNDIRDPATGEMMETLLEGTSLIAGGVETIGAAFLVTSSFFRPDALEAAAEATGGGLLSREKRWSYVKLGRRHGYHLCLVEARGDDFHVAVPEL